MNLKEILTADYEKVKDPEKTLHKDTKSRSKIDAATLKKLGMH